MILIRHAAAGIELGFGTAEEIRSSAICREDVGRRYVQLVPSRQPPSLPHSDGPPKRGEPRDDHKLVNAASQIPCRRAVAVA
jgi:hypothetical protein